MVTTVEARTDLGIQTSDQAAPERTILNLPNLVDNLPSIQREVFHRIFDLDGDEAPVVYQTEEAKKKVAQLFGRPVDTRQGLTVTNKVLDEETLANPLRASRPLQMNPDKLRTTQEVVAGYAKEPNNSPDGCFFCHPETSTPQDPFGPVEGKMSMTVANAAAYSPWNSLVISKIHHPFEMTEEVFSDMVHTGNEWFQRLMEYDEARNRELRMERSPLRFPFIGWNGLFRGGGSIFHPHLQLIARRKPMQQVENLRRRMRDYEVNYEYPYLDELAFCLRPLDLVSDVGDTAHIVFNPAAKKEKEVIVYSDDGNCLPNGDLSRAIFQVTEWWTKRLGLTSFNMALYMPPLRTNVKQEWGDWRNIFPFARVVERGLEGDRTSDFGNMEIYGSSVVASDPFKLAQSFAEYQKERVLVT